MLLEHFCITYIFSQVKHHCRIFVKSEAFSIFVCNKALPPLHLNSICARARNETFSKLSATEDNRRLCDYCFAIAAFTPPNPATNSARVSISLVIFLIFKRIRKINGFYL